MTLVLDRVSRSVAGTDHIRDVSLELRPGTLNVLLGPTLSGKTSLMRLMAGLDHPSRGRVVASGQDVTRVPVRRRDVAMVYQQFVNYPTLTVFENIASPLRVARVPAAQVTERVRAAARLLRIEDMLDRLPQHLSGGQQQRTAIARALVRRAGLVLLDEPLANLDYKLREELREELPRIFADSGAILVYATTEPTEALLLGGNTATLHEGQVTQFGPTLAVYARPRDRRTAEVFSDPPLNFAAAHIRAGVAETEAGIRLPGFDACRDGAVQLAFRPHHLALDRPAVPAVPARAVVEVVEITGSESYVHVACGPARWIALVHGVRDLQPGAAVEVWLDPRRMYVFAPDGALVDAPARAAAA